MKLYHHKTDGGAEYLTDTFIEVTEGHREGTIPDAKFVVRIDGDITKDAELMIRDKADDQNPMAWLSSIQYNVFMQLVEHGEALVKDDDFIDPYGETAEDWTNEKVLIALNDLKMIVINGNIPT